MTDTTYLACDGYELIMFRELGSSGVELHLLLDGREVWDGLVPAFSADYGATLLQSLVVPSGLLLSAIAKLDQIEAAWGDEQQAMMDRPGNDRTVPVCLIAGVLVWVACLYLWLWW